MTEITPRREATRHRLVHAAIDIFAKRGIDGTSVEQLCEAAGFTRGAFYSNFTTKDDICIAILEHHRDVVFRTLGEVFAKPHPENAFDWATDTGLLAFSSVIAPDENLRITLMEIRLRSLRNPELGARAHAIESEFRPDMIAFIENLAAQLDVKLRIPVEQVHQIYEAVFFHLNSRGTPVADHLMRPLAIVLTEQLKDQNADSQD